MAARRETKAKYLQGWEGREIEAAGFLAAAVAACPQDRAGGRPGGGPLGAGPPEGGTAGAGPLEGGGHWAGGRRRAGPLGRGAQRRLRGLGRPSVTSVGSPAPARNFRPDWYHVAFSEPIVTEGSIHWSVKSRGVDPTKRGGVRAFGSGSAGRLQSRPAAGSAPPRGCGRCGPGGHTSRLV